MNVLSLETYKKSKANKKSFFGETVINLPVAPMVLFRTKLAEDNTVKPQAMLPAEVLSYLKDHDGIESDTPFVFSIAGPGDPLATPNETVSAITAVKSEYSQAKCAVRTLGVGGGELAQPLAAAGVDYVELITEGFTVEALEKIYLWLRLGRKTLPLPKASKMLAEEQRLAIAAFKESGVAICGNITWFDDRSIEAIEEICTTLKDFGADGFSMNMADESAMAEVVGRVKSITGSSLSVIESLPNWQITSSKEGVDSIADNLPKPTGGKPNVAVVSSDGMDVNLHLGHADKILIYGPRNDGLQCLIETRQAPASGGGASRWQAMADTLSDCFALLVASAGDNPRQVLGDNGIRVLVVNDPIEGCVDVLYGGGKKQKCKK